MNFSGVQLVIDFINSGPPSMSEEIKTGYFELFFCLSCQHSLLHDLLYPLDFGWLDEIIYGDYQRH